MGKHSLIISLTFNLKQGKWHNGWSFLQKMKEEEHAWRLEFKISVQACSLFNTGIKQNILNILSQSTTVSHLELAGIPSACIKDVQAFPSLI